MRTVIPIANRINVKKKSSHTNVTENRLIGFTSQSLSKYSHRETEEEAWQFEEGVSVRNDIVATAKLIHQMARRSRRLSISTIKGFE